MPKTIYITKATGDREIFSFDKLRRSLRKAQVKRQEVEKVIDQIRGQIKPGMSTAAIYQIVYQTLKKSGKNYAARYSLKRSIMRLGPDGFPFERYLSAVLAEYGYITYTNQIFEGYCLNHEIDVVAEIPEKNIHAIIEAKFHNRPGRKTGAKDALYTHARFLDINKSWVAKRNKGAKPANGELQSWLATNTQVTSEVKKYAMCVGMRVISWGYPPGQNLQNLVEDNGLYPVTSLISLNQRQKRQLLYQNLVLAKSLLDKKNINILKRIGVAGNRLQQLLAEVEALCG